MATGFTDYRIVVSFALSTGDSLPEGIGNAGSFVSATAPLIDGAPGTGGTKNGPAAFEAKLT